MPRMTAGDVQFATAVGRLSYANPFLQERIDLEREALGDEFVAETDAFWSLTPEQSGRRRPNLVRIIERARKLAEPLRARLLHPIAADVDELELYDGLVVYILFYELLDDWGYRATRRSGDDAATAQAWQRFSSQFQYWLELPGRSLPSAHDQVALFELFHQIYRAFFNIFECVLGRSTPAAMLRARIWQSIFTHDLRRYRRGLYRSLDQVTTLVMGPSGSGKELVARAIGLSRYIPFDARAMRFVANPDDHYFAINISAFSRPLVEAELFGHAKGAFTDASTARAGWLEACGERGAVLLDEIGELDPTTQVKLLRVLQNRQYQRLGETKVRDFRGKVIAATNRDLRREIETGGFREDLYYRLCSDVIETPSLAAQVRDNPHALDGLVAYLAARIAPEAAEELSQDVLRWIRQQMPVDYPWPGNIRELEQCIRNVLIAGRYVPTASGGCASELTPDAARLARQIDALELTADDLLRRYCTLAYQRAGSFEKAARLLKLDRRTLRAKTAP